MLIEQLSCRKQKSGRNVREDLLGHLHSPGGGDPGQASLISPVGELRSACPPAIFERDEARVVRIRAPEIELPSSVSLSVLDRIPEQEMYPTEIVGPFVGASILVDVDVLEGEREDASDRSSIFRSHANLGSLTQAVQEVSEPVAGLRRQLLPPSRSPEKVVE